MIKLPFRSSSGSSGRVRGGGAEKHEIYVSNFGGRLFYDLFSQGRGGRGAMAPSPPLDPLLRSIKINYNLYCTHH